MSPSHIDTIRTSSTSSASSSTVSSPTSISPRQSITRASTIAEPSSKFLTRIRGSPSRSRALSSAATNPIPLPAAPKRSSTDTFRSDMAGTRPRPQKRNSGTTMQVGRHSNDWLFGGFSFTGAVRDLLRHEEGKN